MGLIRLFLYNRPMPIWRFLVELGALMIVVAMGAGPETPRTTQARQQVEK